MITLQQIAFSLIRGINIGTATEIIRRCGSIEAYFESDTAVLLSCGLRHEIADSDYRQMLLQDAEQELSFVNDSRTHALMFDMPEFPQRMLQCADAPVLLYRFGEADLNTPRSIAIVGTRHATAMGCQFTRQLITALSEHVGPVTIVSGLAYGIDIAAHRAALGAGMPTVAVVGHGLRTIYPADHRSDAKHIIRQGGALCTEYTSGQRPNKGSFLARNRIIASMTDATIIVESDYRGGAMATARMASAYGREVFAMPGYPQSTYSRGCNRLIANHTAAILADADQLAEALGWQLKQQPGSRQSTLFTELDPVHRRVIDQLRAHPDSTVNDLTIALDMPYATLSSVLFEMEMTDLITSLPGGRYGVII